MAPTLDISKIDLQGFKKEIDALGKEAKAELGQTEIRHIRRMDWLFRIMWVLGIATSWIFINPVSIFLLGMVKSCRWTMIGHYIRHRSYDRIEGIPKMYTSKVFANGWRRFIDWFDWMVPGAWEFEHNYLHHYHTGEQGDPDFLQKNVSTIRSAKLPRFIKYIYAFVLMSTWRFVYYAPNTLFYLEMKKKSNEAVDNAMKYEEEFKKSFPGARIYSPFSKMGWKFWSQCLLPYGLFNFVVIPLLFFPLGTTAMWMVFWNMVLAELFTNIHTFLVVVTNHAGDDVPYFDDRVETKAEFYFRQVVGTVNYSCGNDVVDILHGFNNYQIEHHLYPDMPMNKYRELQPKVEAVCNKYGVPYKKDSVWIRSKKLIDVMVGKVDMQPLNTKVQTKIAS